MANGTTACPSILMGRREQAVELGLGDVRDGAVLADDEDEAPADARAGDGDRRKARERTTARVAVRERARRHDQNTQLTCVSKDAGCVADELVRLFGSVAYVFTRP